MTYHPDPHGLLGWEESFTGFNEQVKVPDTLGVFFEGVLSTYSLGHTEQELIVALVEAYGDLVAHLSELSVQLALKSAAPHYFTRTLNYAARPDLTAPNKENYESEGLI